MGDSGIREPIFEKCPHLREKGGVLTLRTPVGFVLTHTVYTTISKLHVQLYTGRACLRWDIRYIWSQVAGIHGCMAGFQQQVQQKFLAMQADSMDALARLQKQRLSDRATIQGELTDRHQTECSTIRSELADQHRSACTELQRTHKEAFGELAEQLDAAVTRGNENSLL